MKLLIFALAMLFCMPAGASKKPKPVYQDAVLKDFHTEQQGMHCATNGDSDGTIQAKTDDDGNTSGTVRGTSTSTMNCRPRVVTFYTLVLGAHLYVLTPTHSAMAKEGTMLGAAFLFNIPSAFQKESTLVGALPGAPVKIRSENGRFFVKVGKRESEYKLVSAQ